MVIKCQPVFLSLKPLNNQSGHCHSIPKLQSASVMWKHRLFCKLCCRQPDHNVPGLWSTPANTDV